MEDFMEGNECHVSYEVMRKAWLRFWSKNQLAVNKRGKVYRTSIPRKMPVRNKFNFTNERSKKTVLPRI